MSLDGKALWITGIIALLVLSPRMGYSIPDPRDEYIIISGGPSLSEWENYRVEAARHDKWWGNFVRSARMRIQQLQKFYPNGINITWLVHRESYARRAGEDGEPLISFVESVRDKYGVKLVYFSTGDDVINYMNRGQNRRQVKIGGFEYFGHSNKYCFTFDYSNHILGASQSYLHQKDLSRIDRGAFSRDAYAKSWGCHSGESFSAAFKKATGVKMVGAVGKTDYSDLWKGVMPFVSPGGRWSE